MNWLILHLRLTQSCQWTYPIQTFVLLRVAKIPKIFKPTSGLWSSMSINTGVSQCEWGYFVTLIWLTTDNQHFSFVIFFMHLLITAHPEIQRLILFPQEAPRMAAKQLMKAAYSVLLGTKNRGQTALRHDPATFLFLGRSMHMIQNCSSFYPINGCRTV